jgi:hypothetical protein
MTSKITNDVSLDYIRPFLLEPHPRTTHYCTLYDHCCGSALESQKAKTKRAQILCGDQAFAFQ